MERDFTPLFRNKEHMFTNYSPDKVVTQEEVTCFQLQDSLLRINISRVSGRGGQSILWFGMRGIQQKCRGVRFYSDS